MYRCGNALEKSLERVCMVTLRGDETTSERESQTAHLADYQALKKHFNGYLLFVI